jgi:hypothetical protein
MMRGWLTGSVLGLGLLVCAGSAAGQGGKPNPRRTGWLEDYPEAKAVARRSGKPMLLVFR